MYGAIKEDLRKKLDVIRTEGLYKEERVIATPQGARIRVRGGIDVLNFCANNYLGLANHPAIREASRKAQEAWGYGLSSVRFICGTQEPHKSLEKAAAGFSGHGRRNPVFLLLRRQRWRLRTPAGRGLRHHHGLPESRLHHRRRSAVQGPALDLEARRPARRRGAGSGYRKTGQGPRALSQGGGRAASIAW